MLYKLKSKTLIDSWAILFLFTIGLIIRLYNLGAVSLNDPEISTTARINHSFLETIFLLRHSEFPPLHYIILKLWVSVFGNGEWALRFPSAFFSSLTIIVIYKLGKELFSKDVGLISALWLSFSSFSIGYAQFAKMYSLFWFLGSLSFLFFFRFLKDQRERFYCSYIIVSILSCYTMFTGLLFLVTQNIIFLLVAERSRWRKWFIGQFIVVSFCLAWIIYFLSSEHDFWHFYTLPSGTFDYLGFFFNVFVQSLGGLFLNLGKIDCFLFVFLSLFLILFLLINAFSYKDKKVRFFLPKNYYFLFMWIIIPIFIYFMVNELFLHVTIGERHIGFIHVPLILLVSSQINNFQGRVKKILVLVLVVYTLKSSFLYFRDNLSSGTEDWRKTSQELTQKLKKDDIILCTVDISWFKYYYKGDTSRFFQTRQEDISTEFLEKKGLYAEPIHSIYVIFSKQTGYPLIDFDRYTLDYKVTNGGIGFLHFERNQSEAIRSKNNVCVEQHSSSP